MGVGGGGLGLDTPPREISMARKYLPLWTNSFSVSKFCPSRISSVFESFKYQGCRNGGAHKSRFQTLNFDNFLIYLSSDFDQIYVKMQDFSRFLCQGQLFSGLVFPLKLFEYNGESCEGLYGSSCNISI